MSALLRGRWDDYVRMAIVQAAEKVLATARAKPDEVVQLLPGHLQTMLMLEQATGRIVIVRPTDWVYGAALTAEPPWPPVMITANVLAQDYLYRELASLPDVNVDAALEALGPLATGKWQVILDSCSSLDPQLKPTFRRFYSTVPHFPVSIAYPANTFYLFEPRPNRQRYTLTFNMGENSGVEISHQPIDPDSDLYRMVEALPPRQPGHYLGFKIRQDEVPVGALGADGLPAFQAPFATWRHGNGTEGMCVFFESQRPGFCWIIWWQSGRYARDTFNTMLASFRWMLPDDFERLPPPPIRWLST